MISFKPAKFRRLIAIAILILPFNANSTLVEMDWDNAASGNLNILYDTTTQLEWLDVSVTFGMSWDDVQAAFTSGNTLEGFRYATKAEISNLWAEAGFSQHSYDESPSGNGLTEVSQTEYQSLVTLQNMLNDSTAGFHGLLQGYWGPLDDDPDFEVRIADLQWWNDGSTFAVGTYFYDATQTDSSTSLRGSYLIKEELSAAVPLPPSLLLFFSGFIALLGLSKHRSV